MTSVQSAAMKDEERLNLLEKGEYPPQVETVPTLKTSPPLGWRFVMIASINTIATVGIVFVNKHLFENEYLRHSQSTFAAFHFVCTSVTLYVLSRPSVNVFEAKRAPIRQILPLAAAMILNVVLPNASLACSSVTFYQIARVLLTPCTAALNYVILGTTLPRSAALALVPVCLGVAVVSYYDTAKASPGKATAPLGVIFAFTGVLMSAVYTVWIAKYHKTLKLSSMQLLLNQAPLSAFLLLYVIPFVDDITIWRQSLGSMWISIVLSGILACAVNVSQFYIINEAGPVSSTVVGHFKTCIIVALGWVTSGRSIRDGTVVGIIAALGGIISYSAIMHKRASV